MATNADLIAKNIHALKASSAIRNQLKEFVTAIMDLYTDGLVSIMAFGSVVTGDYDEAESDVNLLVVYNDLNIVDLARAADLSRRWLRKQRFAPRFLSRRNLEESARYFQVDFIEMRDAHVVLWGEDVLAGMELRPAELRWQIAYEVKAMRMRLKQQFWRTANDPPRMRAVLVQRFGSLIHLMRALLRLYNQPVPLTRRETLDVAIVRFGIDRAFADRMMALRQSRSTPSSATLTTLFTGLMDMIRTVDSRVEEVKL